MLSQHMWMKTHQYPRSLENTMNVLKTDTKKSQGEHKAKITPKFNQRETEFMVTQSKKDEQTERKSGNVTCYHSGQMGYYATECSKKNNDIHITI